MRHTRDNGRRLACGGFALLLAFPCCARASFGILWPCAESAGRLERSSLVTRVLSTADRDSSTTAGTAAAGSVAAEAAAAGSVAAEAVAAGTVRLAGVTLSGGELHGLREARGGRATVEVGFRAVSLGVEAAVLGGELYQERVVGVATGWSPRPDLSVALGVRCLGIRARGLDGLWSAAVDAGVLSRVLGRIQLVAVTENATHSQIGGSPVTSRTTLSAALRLPSASVSCGIALEGDLDPALTVGVEAGLTPWLRIRAGACDAPGKLALGVGLGRPRGRPLPVVDVAWQWHPRLGVSSFASVRFSL